MSKYPNNWAVVVPLANEEAELEEFAAALRSVMDSMEQSYQTLIRHGWVGSEEECLLEAWLDDLGHIASSR